MFSRSIALTFVFVLGAAGCAGSTPVDESGDAGPDSGSVSNANDAGTSTCTLLANTAETNVASPSGCHVLTRDTSGCAAARSAAGLSGFWLKFSCRVALRTTTVDGESVVEATTDGRPDYLSNYYASSNPCSESYTDALQNPNSISAQNEVINFYTAPNTTATNLQGAIVGLTVSGVPIFGNFAAPGDDIYQEALTFDRCAGHPQNSGVYHVHTEPYSISYDDSNFIGVMRDGYPVYGRRDSNGTYPTLDTYGGHTGTTPDSPSTPVYHYHLSLQTSTGATTSGQTQWFLSGPGKQYRGSAAPCTAGCN